MSETTAVDGAAAAADKVVGVAQSATGRAWVRRLDAGKERTAMALAQRHDVPEIAARVLAARGVTLENAAEELAPTIRAL
ncbi:MAG: single-stranded-DNA-specific exonuclease RecJ, partial [Pseudomonadota bacterium]